MPGLLGKFDLSGKYNACTALASSALVLVTLLTKMFKWVYKSRGVKTLPRRSTYVRVRARAAGRRLHAHAYVRTFYINRYRYRGIYTGTGRRAGRRRTRHHMHGHAYDRRAYACMRMRMHAYVRL